MAELHHMSVQVNARIKPLLFICDEDEFGFAVMIEQIRLELPA